MQPKNQTFTEKFLGDKKFIKLIFYIFIPIAIQSLVTISITYVDNFFIANFAIEGTNAKTALGLVGPVVLIPQFILMGTLTGAGIMTAQYYGKGEIEKLKETILFKILAGIIIGAIALTILMSLPEQIINVVSSSDNDQIKNFAQIYLFWSGVSMIPLGVAFALEFSLKDTNQPMIPLIASIIAMVVNITLNPILIMDPNISDEDKIRNIALATALARVIEASVILIWLAFKKSNSNYFYDCKRISKDVVSKIFKYGWQICSNESLFGVLNAFFIVCTFHYNPALEDAMTTYALITQFASLIWPPTAAVCSIIIGHELGKNNIAQAKYNSRKAINWAILFSLFLGSCILISTTFINRLLSPNASDEMIQLTTEIEYVLVAVVLLQGPYSIMYYSLRAGSSKYLIFVDGITSGFFAIIIGIIVFVPGIKEHVSPIWFIILLEADNIMRLLIAFFAYNFSNWTNDLTYTKKHLHLHKNDRDLNNN
ncbi:MAG: MATE family efflux transporter [Mycoplasmoidaceae bacterium]